MGILYGEFDGVKVHETEENVVVEVSKFENKVAAVFKGKSGDEFYSTYLNDKSVEAQPGNSLLAIPKRRLQSDEQVADFNSRLSNATRIHNEIKKDFEDIHTLAKDQLGTDKRVVFRYGQDENRKKPGEKQNWAFGTVMGRNSNYVAFSAGESDNAKFVRVFPVEKFLLTKEEEQKAEEILSRRLANGDFKRIVWKSEEGKQTKITVEDAVRKQAEAKSEAKSEAKKEAVVETTAEKKAQAADSKTGGKKKKAELAAA